MPENVIHWDLVGIVAHCFPRYFAFRSQFVLNRSFLKIATYNTFVYFYLIIISNRKCNATICFGEFIEQFSGKYIFPSLIQSHFVILNDDYFESGKIAWQTQWSILCLYQNNRQIDNEKLYERVRKVERERERGKATESSKIHERW